MSTNALKKNDQRHPYHLVDPSPWPFVGSIGGLGLTFGGVMLCITIQVDGLFFV